MKGFKFYLEYPTPAEKKKGTVKNPGNHSGNVIAVCEGSLYRSAVGYVWEVLCAVTYLPDSEVCTSTAHVDYLMVNCKKIPESLARTIHPNLFKVLDNC